MLLTPLFTAAQEKYVVQQVRGEIKDGRRNVVVGDHLSGDVKLVFGKGARMLISSQRLGRIVVAQDPARVKSEISYMLADLLPATARLSTRSSKTMTNAMDFRNFFGEGDYTIIGGTLEIRVNSKSFPLNTSHFFYATYPHPVTHAPVNKKLLFSGDTIIIQKDSLFFVDGKSLGQVGEVVPVSLFYYDVSAEKSFPITEARLGFFADDTFRGVMSDVVEMASWSASPSTENFQAIVASGVLALNRPGHNNLEDWLSRVFRVVRPSP